MPNIHLPLNELIPANKNYSVVVKVAEKTRPKSWPRNGIPYQILLLEDEMGRKMRGILFGEQIDLYKHDLAYSGRYEISNAPIKIGRTEHEVNPGHHKHLMLFNRLTEIRPLENATDPIHPNYQSICQIPKVARRKDIYDIIGIVLFVEEDTHIVTTQHGKKYPVRELVIIDNNTEHPLLITAWNDLASTTCDLLISKAKKLDIVGFTALKISTYKGYSMATTVSTTVIPSPTGEKKGILADWRRLNRPKLKEIQECIIDARRSFPNKYKTTIAALSNKKKYNTAQAEKYILKVEIPEPSFDNLTAYLGCSECEAQTNKKEGDVYYCTVCFKDNVTPLPRVTFNCQVSDGTGNLAITALTTNAEKILQMQAADIFRILQTGNYKALESTKTQLQKSQFTMVVAPTTTPSASNAQHWILETIEPYFCNNPTNTTTEASTTATGNTEEKLSTESHPHEQPETNTKPAEIPTENISTLSKYTEETMPMDTNPEDQSTLTVQVSAKRALIFQGMIQDKIEKVRKILPQDTVATAETNNVTKQDSGPSTNP